MTFLGCELRRPSLTRLSVSVALGVANWLVIVYVLLRDASLDTLSLALIASVYSFTAPEFGLDSTKGWRPALLNVVICALLMIGALITLPLFAGSAPK